MGEENLENLRGFLAINRLCAHRLDRERYRPDCPHKELARFRYRIRRFSPYDHRAAWHRCRCRKPDEMDTRGSHCKESDTVRRTAPEPT